MNRKIAANILLILMLLLFLAMIVNITGCTTAKPKKGCPDNTAAWERRTKFKA